MFNVGDKVVLKDTVSEHELIKYGFGTQEKVHLKQKMVLTITSNPFSMGGEIRVLFKFPNDLFGGFEYWIPESCLEYYQQEQVLFGGD